MGKVIKSVRVLIMCSGSVRPIVVNSDFLLELQEKLGNEFEHFDSLDSLGKSSFILGSELWEDHFHSLLRITLLTSGKCTN